MTTGTDTQKRGAVALRYFDIFRQWSAQLIDQTYNKSIFLETHYWLKKTLDGDPVGRIQASTFRELRIRKSTK